MKLNPNLSNDPAVYEGLCQTLSETLLDREFNIKLCFRAFVDQSAATMHLPAKIGK